MADDITCTYNSNGEVFYIGDTVKFGNSNMKPRIIQSFYISPAYTHPCWNAEDGSSAWIPENLVLVKRAKDSKEDGWASI